jgi:uracil-DNA glycosylase
MSRLNFIGDWRKLRYWSTGEWQVIKEKLDEAIYNPGNSKLFAALRAVHPGPCRVAILGQDPYPDPRLCTGIAFEAPGLTPSLKNIYSELEADLGITQPTHGDLSRWCEQGVLLWNVYPTCAPGKPGSHHWDEWEYLTREIVEKLDGQVVFAALGTVAAKFVDHVTKSPVIRTSHPSPLGVRHGFAGSKLFSRINLSLSGMNKDPIDWRLDNGQLQRTDHKSIGGAELSLH